MVKLLSLLAAQYAAQLCKIIFPIVCHVVGCQLTEGIGFRFFPTYGEDMIMCMSIVYSSLNLLSLCQCIFPLMLSLCRIICNVGRRRTNLWRPGSGQVLHLPKPSAEGSEPNCFRILTASPEEVTVVLCVIDLDATHSLICFRTHTHAT